jgi:hypothetical protein
MWAKDWSNGKDGEGFDFEEEMKEWANPVDKLVKQQGRVRAADRTARVAEETVRASVISVFDKWERERGERERESEREGGRERKRARLILFEAYRHHHTMS